MGGLREHVDWLDVLELEAVLAGQLDVEQDQHRLVREGKANPVKKGQVEEKGFHGNNGQHQDKGLHEEKGIREGKGNREEKGIHEGKGQAKAREF